MGIDGFCVFSLFGTQFPLPEPVQGKSCPINLKAVDKVWHRIILKSADQDLRRIGSYSHYEKVDTNVQTLGALWRC
jgi:hypothetical protein